MNTVVAVPFHDAIAGVGCSLSAMRNTGPVFYADIINYERPRKKTADTMIAHSRVPWLGTATKWPSCIFSKDEANYSIQIGSFMYKEIYRLDSTGSE
jgi:hypothetical protein